MDKPSILIVDSDSDLTDILSKRFTVAGWATKTAKDINQTEKELEKKVFDVILFDPDTDDEASVFLAKLQKNKKTEGSIKIIHTNLSDRDMVSEFQKTQTNVLWLKGSVSISDIVKKTKTFFEERKI